MIRRTAIKRSTKPIPKRRKKGPRPGRLDAKGMRALREERYRMDEAKCTDCGRMLLLDIPWLMHPNRMHLAHIISRGAGGPDTIENTTSKCSGCHVVKEHAYGPSRTKPVPPKGPK
jgi:5-methylcytosine-specific restriction endonuclease McrA